ncbi:hypothetical protein TNCV_2358971 [Trichonephila clavipes]|nr:hypothetical protein TNCV_2358971 [Trichonephila clavipes]
MQRQHGQRQNARFLLQCHIYRRPVLMVKASITFHFWYSLRAHRRCVPEILQAIAVSFRNYLFETLFQQDNAQSQKDGIFRACLQNVDVLLMTIMFNRFIID